MKNRKVLMQNDRVSGFTLLEILIALFIFSILSLLLATALHTVINTQARTERKAEQLRNLQITFITLSRDIEQAVNRPVLNTNGKEEGAFIGSPIGFSFTHMGFANPTDVLAHSTLQRTRYYWSESSLWRATWPVLDQAPQSQPHARLLLQGISAIRFQYLAKDKHFYDNWPVAGEVNQPLPVAVSITLTILHRGEINQLYVIPT